MGPCSEGGKKKVELAPGTSLDSLNANLRHIGRLPRRLSFGLLLVSSVAAWAGWIASGSWLLLIVIAGVPAIIFLLSLRIHASATEHALTVRSYVRTHIIVFGAGPIFVNGPYEGMWNRGVGTDNWLNLGMRMMEVEWESRPGPSIPASMCGPATCRRVVAQLNARVTSGEG